MNREGEPEPHRRAGGQQRLPEVPADWRVLRTSGPGRFVTHAWLRRPDGREVEWTSRRHRKRLGLLGDEHPSGATAGDPARQRPSAASCWMGALFAIGSICFALGSTPLYFDHIAAPVVAATFFIGSLFFTSASSLQYRETRSTPAGIEPGSTAPRGLRALLGASPRRIDWWAAAVQLVGTVFFNLSTFAATRSDLSVDQARRLIWAPDVAGSICFLVASWLAYAEANAGVRPRPDGSTGWRIAALNMVGSIAFGASAVAARYLRTTGEPANIVLVNVGTFLGAICFLAGAVLLPVESATETTATEATATGGAR